VLESAGATHFDLVEAGAGSGRLTRDILDAAARRHPALYGRLRVTLVERSTAARAVQASTLTDHDGVIGASQASLPSRLTGLLLANELLDAMPVHVMTVRAGIIREVHVTEHHGRLLELELEPSDPALSERLRGPDPPLPPPVWRGEISLEAERWIAAAGQAIERGFMLLFDYGHEQTELRSATRIREART
jgi:SAM-dependent MidA family methyltransferase